MIERMSSSQPTPEQERAARYKEELYAYKDFVPGLYPRFQADEQEMLEKAVEPDGVLGRMKVTNIETTDPVEVEKLGIGIADYPNMLKGEIKVTIMDADNNGVSMDFDYFIFRDQKRSDTDLQTGRFLVHLGLVRSLPGNQYPALTEMIPSLVKMAGAIGAGSRSRAWGLPMPQGINLPGFREAQEEGERILHQLGLEKRERGPKRSD